MRFIADTVRSIKDKWGGINKCVSIGPMNVS